MSCIYAGNWKGECMLWDKGSDLNPEGADENGWCCAEDDEDPTWCQSFENAEREELCDYCGEPLGFCQVDCETRMEGFEE